MTDLRPHLPRLRRYARALTGDIHAADDLLQDTVERALSRWFQFRSGSKLDAWLLTIMHNLFVNQYHARQASPPILPLDDASDSAIRDSNSDVLGLRDLDRALARLPLQQREVLLLVTLEELSYQDTARILDIPVGTVMSRLSRARENLRQLLAGDSAPAATPGVTHLKVVS